MDPSEPALKEYQGSVTRMQLSSSGAQKKPKGREPIVKDVEALTAEWRRKDRHTITELADAFLMYCYWKTLCPLHLQTAPVPPAVRYLGQEVNGQGVEAELCRVELHPSQEQDVVGLVEIPDIRVGDVLLAHGRRNVAWLDHRTPRNWHMGAELVRSMPEYPELRGLLKTSMERCWLNSLRGLIPNPDDWIRKPSTRFNLVGRTKADASKNDQKLAQENAEEVQSMRAIIDNIVDLRSLDGRDGLAGISLQMLMHTVYPEGHEYVVHEMTQPRDEPGPSEDATMVQDLSMEVYTKFRLIQFRCWLPGIVPRKFMYAQDNNGPAVVRAWACFFNPLLLGFIDEYML